MRTFVGPGMERQAVEGKGKGVDVPQSRERKKEREKVLA